MTKERVPLSVDGALARIAGQLPGSWALMAEITGYQERTVRAWGDNDRDEQINLPAAVALDIAYQQHGGVGRPLFDVYGYLLGLAQVEHFAQPFDILRHAVDVVRESGDAKAALLEAALPDASADDRRRAQRELLEAIEVMKRALLVLDRRDPPRITPPP